MHVGNGMPPLYLYYLIFSDQPIKLERVYYAVEDDVLTENCCVVENKFID